MEGKVVREEPLEIEMSGNTFEAVKRTPEKVTKHVEPSNFGRSLGFCVRYAELLAFLEQIEQLQAEIGDLRAHCAGH